MLTHEIVASVIRNDTGPDTFDTARNVVSRPPAEPRAAASFILAHMTDDLSKVAAIVSFDEEEKKLLDVLTDGLRELVDRRRWTVRPKGNFVLRAQSPWPHAFFEDLSEEVERRSVWRFEHPRVVRTGTREGYARAKSDLMEEWRISSTPVRMKSIDLRGFKFLADVLAGRASDAQIERHLASR